DDAPRGRGARDRVGEAWVAVECKLAVPRRRAERADRAHHFALVTVEGSRDRLLGGDACARGSLEDAVAGERVGETGRVADEKCRAAAERRARVAHRQPVAARVLERAPLESVPDEQPVEVRTEPRSLRFPGDDADVQMVALREDPAVAAGDDAELEHG